MMNSLENITIYPCLWIEKNAGHVLEYYVDIFDNSAISLSNDMLSMGKLEGLKFLILNGNTNASPNATLSLMVVTDDKEKITRYYEALKKGGNEMMPLNKYEWSEWYGWVVDKYGISWQLYTSKDPVNTKITPTIMYCNTQQGKCLEAQEMFKSIFTNYQSDGVLLYEEGPMKGMVNHTQFHLNNNMLMAMDSGVEQNFDFNESASLVVECRNQEAIDYYWNSFIEKGGSPSKCGWLKDAFGFSWQIIPYNFDELLFNSKNFNKSLENMLKMDKIIIADY